MKHVFEFFMPIFFLGAGVFLKSFVELFLVVVTNFKVVDRNV